MAEPLFVEEESVEETIYNSLHKISSLSELVIWLENNYPDKMVMEPMSEWDRGKLAGETNLAQALIEVFKGKI